MNNYISYYRVSTKQQGDSGLGLESQQRSVHQFIKSTNGNLIKEYTDIASGAKDRTNLNEAILDCIKHQAILVVKKLDRLSRGGFKIAVRLDELGVKYIESDSPNDSELLKNLKLAIAKDERQKISERTKAALNELKAKGVQLGKGDNFTQDGRIKGVEAIKTKAKNNVNNRKAKAFINALVTQGLNYSKIAEQLNDNGFVTSRGKAFQAVQVQRLVSI